LNGNVRLARTLGLPSLAFYGIGQILGAGIYSVIGAAAGLAGEAMWLSFLMATGVALLTGLSYAELASSFPAAGAEYVYMRHAFPKWPWAPFATGIVIVASGAATAATVALAFGGYLQDFVPQSPVLAAGVLLALFTLLNILGIRQSSWTNVLFTLVEAAGLVLVIGIGVTRPQFGAAILVRPQPGVFAGAALVFFAYLGFEDIANLSEEARDPARDLPRAIFLTLGITTVLYILVSLASVALVPPQRLAASDAPLAAALAEAAPVLAGVVGAIALFATANTALITLIVGSRMLFAMARAGDLPGSLARVLPRRQTPWIAAIAMLAGATLLLPFRNVAIVASLSSFGALIAFTTVHISLVVLRHRAADHTRPFRVPLALGSTPILPVLGALSTLFLLLQFDPVVYLVGGVVFLAAAALYAVRQRFFR
jgi:amino acid transporter